MTNDETIALRVTVIGGQRYADDCLALNAALQCADG
jgi:hypothetical protein